jgi:hypothetical protein
MLNPFGFADAVLAVTEATAQIAGVALSCPASIAQFLTLLCQSLIRDSTGIIRCYPVVPGRTPRALLLRHALLVRQLARVAVIKFAHKMMLTVTTAVRVQGVVHSFIWSLAIASDVLIQTLFLSYSLECALLSYLSQFSYPRHRLPLLDSQPNIL